MNSYSIKGFDHCELYVSNAKQAAHYYRTTLGFLPIAYCGLETGSRDRVSYVLKQNQVRFILTSPLENNSEIGTPRNLCKNRTRGKLRIYNGYYQ